MRSPERAEHPHPAGLPALTTRDLAATVDTIAAAQLPSGCIPWFEGGHADPWDHVESTMALVVGGRLAEADRAFEWLLSTQRPDGAWASYYRGGEVEDPTLDANICGYLAVGAWHRHLVERDRGFLESLWPAVERAIEFVLALQQSNGAVLWARDALGAPAGYALLAGSSSLYMSLRCALATAHELGLERPDWELSLGALGHAVAHHTEIFDPRERWSMDWYYPVLGGAVRADAARRRLDAGWRHFVVDGFGVRCVADEVWVTGAETSECVLALDAAGRTDAARQLFEWAQFLRADDGSYWTGWSVPMQVHYPEGERSTWTAAAMVLAADALSGWTPASGLFRGVDLPDGVDPAEAACCEATTQVAG